MPEQDGLEWVVKAFHLQPSWTKEPNINIISRIARKHLGYDDEYPIDVIFYAQGGFNKLYKISTVDSDCLMRVSLPVDPRHKTESEVATIKFVRKETDMPVPRIIAFDSDNRNELGFEWILMEMMPGATLWKRWRKMSWKAKEEIVRRLARYQAQLFEKRFGEIGNIFLQHNEVIRATEEADSWFEPFILDRLVSLTFFWGDRLTHDVPRGPFKSNHDWLQTRLQFILTDQEAILKTTDDEDEIEDAEFAKELAEKLLQVLPNIFPPDASDFEPTILFHDDLSMQNILVDEDGEMTAILDWECVSAVPLWRACQLPDFLEGRSRDEEPNRAIYAPDSEDEGNDSESLDNEGVCDLYWRQLLEYEHTKLRKLFVDEMDKLKPDWVTKMKESSLKADFEKAVLNSDNCWSFKIVRRWLDALVEGNVQSLVDEFVK